jgi:aspartate/methionine/tyrosine aminotransferase
VALRQRLGRAPRVFVAGPCYGVLPPTLRSAGCEVDVGPLAHLYEGKGASPDAVVISQPANPAGLYLSHELMAMARWVVEHRCWLVSDEIFGLVNLGNPTAETVPSPTTLESAVPGITARTLLLGGLAKEFAAGGLRVGWLATQDAELAGDIGGVGLGRLQLASARAASHLYASSKSALREDPRRGEWRRVVLGSRAHPRGLLHSTRETGEGARPDHLIRPRSRRPPRLPVDPAPPRDWEE